MRRRLGFVPALIVALASSFTTACAPEESTAESTSRAVPDLQPSSSPESRSLGNGFLVWESNRSGDWRIWTRRLEPSAPRRLTPDEKGRQHCCPHISPDGLWIAYLSFAGTANSAGGYGAGGSRGSLHLIRRDGTEDRILAERALSSWENRAAVWRSPSELIYIRGNGSTVRHDLESDRTEVLAAAQTGKTWLINSRLSHAVSGVPDFSTFNHAGAPIAPGRTYAGCQPYFSHDGRWGFWAAGAGGPISRIDLQTQEVSTVLAKSDARVPDDLGYAYFPMFSRDGRLFAFAASDGGHDHFKADYEIFVAESDPETLELLGNAVRMTSHPATDRFPDAFLEPLALGRHRGEAPFTVTLTTGGSEPARWDFGDRGDSGDADSPTPGPDATHTYAAGVYEVSARTSGPESKELRGRIVVEPAAPPKPIGVRLKGGGRTVVVHFDEEITANRPRLQFESGVSVARWSLGDDGRSLVIHLDGKIEEFDRLELDGISDRAQRPNSIAPLALEIEPPLWPSDRRELAFIWETGESANSIWDPGLGAERSSSLTSSKGAYLDRDFAMVLDGGSFAAPAAEADSVLAACRRSNEFSLEVVLRPKPATTPDLRRIISFSGGTPRSRNFVLAQRSDRLVFSPRTGNPPPNEFPEIDLAPLPAGVKSHVLISYQAGRLLAFLNGEPVLDTDTVQGGFFHWRRRPFLFGDGPSGGQSWRGDIEGVAIYGRAIGGDEARENFLRYRKKLATRPSVPELVVEATLVARSAPPSLAEISPYRDALAVFEYRVDRVVEGAYPEGRIRVVHRSILDGDLLEINRNPQIGGRLRLTLEPFAANRQLESLYLADSLESKTAPLFFAVNAGE